MTKHQLLIQQFRRYANNVDLITRAHSTEMLNGYGNSELNCIDCIGRAKRPTASSISKEMDITRSGISKVLRRLVSKGAIQSYQLPSNQKEIYYCLTPYGQEIFKQHRAAPPELGGSRPHVLSESEQRDVGYGTSIHEYL